MRRVKEAKGERDSKNKIVKECQSREEAFSISWKTQKTSAWKSMTKTRSTRKYPCRCRTSWKTRLTGLNGISRPKRPFCQAWRGALNKIEKLQESFNLARTREKLKGDLAHGPLGDQEACRRGLEFTQQLMSTACTLPRKNMTNCCALRSDKRNQKPGGPEVQGNWMISGSRQNWGAHATCRASRRCTMRKKSAINEEKRKRGRREEREGKRAKRAGTEALHGLHERKKAHLAGTYHHTEVRVGRLPAYSRRVLQHTRTVLTWMRSIRKSGLYLISTQTQRTKAPR